MFYAFYLKIKMITSLTKRNKHKKKTQRNLLKFDKRFFKNYSILTK